MFNKAKKFIRDLRKKCVKSWVSGNRSTNQYGSDGLTTTSVAPVTGGKEPSFISDKRIEKKPVEVVNEVLGEMPKMNMTDLKGQLKVVEKRVRTLEKLKANITQEKEVVGYLKARIKFLKYGHKFTWVTTNDTLIEKLCNTYKLRRVCFASYARNIPAEAVDEIEKYIDAMTLIDKEKEPVFELIIDDGGKETRKDPILFVKSPFGRWYYILGAWDKEVEVIDEIIYNGK